MKFVGEGNFVDVNEVDLVVFDIDGVLMCTSLFEAAQSLTALDWAGELPECKLPADEDLIVTIERQKVIQARIHEAATNSNGDPVLHYTKLLSVDRLDQSFWNFNRQTIELFKSLQFPEVGALEFLKDLYDNNTPAAAWTSRNRELLTPELCPLIIREDGPRSEGWFDLTISADDVVAAGRKRLKPDTHGLELIQAHFGIPFKNILMIGDRPSDIIPAINLGAMACAIAFKGSLIEPQRLLDAKPTFMAESIDEVRQRFADYYKTLEAI